VRNPPAKASALWLVVVVALTLAASFAAYQQISRTPTTTMSAHAVRRHVHAGHPLYVDTHRNTALQYVLQSAYHRLTGLPVTRSRGSGPSSPGSPSRGGGLVVFRSRARTGSRSWAASSGSSIWSACASSRGIREAAHARRRRRRAVQRPGSMHGGGLGARYGSRRRHEAERRPLSARQPDARATAARTARPASAAPGRRGRGRGDAALRGDGGAPALTVGAAPRDPRRGGDARDGRDRNRCRSPGGRDAGAARRLRRGRRRRHPRVSRRSRRDRELDREHRRR
jgi:hypothetical protein